MDKNDQLLRMKALSDDVLRKIGRNVLLFQHIEGLLKFLNANHHVDGTLSDLVKRQEKRAKKIQRQMMGNLSEQYINGILSDGGTAPKGPKEATQLWASFTYTITGDNDFIEAQRTGRELMLRDRNELIHHFLPRWHPDSLEQMTEASTYLDQQYEKVLPMFEHLKSVAKSMQQAREMMAAWLASDEGERMLDGLATEQSTGGLTAGSGNTKGSP